MTQGFLCARHRAWLCEQPGAIDSVWERAYDTALLYQEQGEPYQALRHAGAALEAADIALVQSGVLEIKAIERYGDACHLMAGVLNGLDDARAVNSLVEASVQRLGSALAVGGPREVILSACKRLTQWVSAPHAQPVH